MVGSTKTTSFADESTSVIMLNVKPSLNLILNLDASRYNEALKPMIECPRYSPLAHALTMVDNVPFVHLSKAYSSATYNQQKGVIHLLPTKTSISKSRFCRILGLTTIEGPIDP